MSGTPTGRSLPTESIGSVPRPKLLVDAIDRMGSVPPPQLGTTEDCGFSPFCDDVSTTRESVFTKIQARIEGTALASRILGIFA
jgi:5-methyltetrahydropteroyltriglutamate--homocysteine methyltransferase